MDEDQELIARHVEPDPNRPGPGDVRLAGSAVPVWAVIGHLAANGWRADDAAADYAIPGEEVAAAAAYYRRHTDAINARLAANSGASAPVPAGAA
ncbi:MAG: DUF433 domain-containing protein [Chloroflexota bacterium]|nr:DUF433 domain-containing protein [Chloroflexota bacterium]